VGVSAENGKYFAGAFIKGGKRVGMDSFVNDLGNNPLIYYYATAILK
jgi:hypothetical protein